MTFELEDIIALHGRQILVYCHNILCNYHDAQDAVQVTFIKAYNKRGSYKPTVSLSAWLYKIAYNTCIDIIRKRRFSLTGLWGGRPEGSYQMEENYISEELKGALLTLSARDRALVYNRVIDDMDYKELAVIYNASEAALRKRYERAKNKLAEQLEAAGIANSIRNGADRVAPENME